MAVSFAFHSDAALTNPITSLQCSEEVGGSGVDKTVYLGSTETGMKIQAASDPGVDQITLTPTSKYSAWAATTAYALDDRARTTAANGYLYKCTTAGTSGSSEPTWPTTLGATVSDGTVVWTCERKLHEVSEIKLALTAGGLDSATGGAALDIGTQVLSGVANAQDIHIRADDTTDTVSTLTDIGLALNTVEESAV